MFKWTGKRKGEMKSPFVKWQMTEKERGRESEHLNEKLQPGCKISNQKRNCKVGANGKKVFNKTKILKIVEDSHREFASGIARRAKVRCPKTGSG